MRYGLLFAITLACLSLASALTAKDVQLIAEIKLATEQAYQQLLHGHLKFLIQVIEYIAGSQVVDQSIIRQLRSQKLRAEAKLEMPRLKESDLDEILDEWERILDVNNINGDQRRERIYLYLKDKYGDIFNMNEQKLHRQIQVFTYAINPKMRELSKSAQQSEHELITSFNNVAYAGLVSPEESFTDFAKVMNKY
ncbi:uncharacterized protein Dvir_GJ25707 [Drosophila virilis]|uniref:Uncharacterized protein n=1 Tax=Drosophila virilis TaxID=7244 RepID=A0A0Q9WLG8_DROVI|nr:uncharacterized protein LOC26530477 [Drosophila virilis]KRF81232.1 uncharacterized protein Dvir_GJ25707 [Drosophila virilis]